MKLSAANKKFNNARSSLGRSPESWLAMQYNYELWQARRHVKLGGVSKVRLTAA
jgi:plasmid maintenance system antidote protein VapI